jgi:Double-stranded RNA binding motif
MNIQRHAQSITLPPHSFSSPSLSFLVSGLFYCSPPVTMKQPSTPKAIIHQKFGMKACYRIEEVADATENVCPGLAIPQQTKIQYRCVLELPDLTVSSGFFSRKKDAEQSAAQIAIEKVVTQCCTIVLIIDI